MFQLFPCQKLRHHSTLKSPHPCPKLAYHIRNSNKKLQGMFACRLIPNLYPISRKFDCWAKYCCCPIPNSLQFKTKAQKRWMTVRVCRICSERLTKQEISRGTCQACENAVSKLVTQKLLKLGSYPRKAKIKA